MNIKDSYVDVGTNALQADTISQGDYFFEDKPSGEDSLLFFVETDKGWVSQYPPLTSLYGSVAYFFAPDEYFQLGTLNTDGDTVVLDVPITWPGSIMGALAAAVSVALVFGMVKDIFDEKTAAITTFLYGACTSVWTIAGTALWMHSLDLSLLVGASWAYTRRSWWLSGGLIGLAILARPTIGIMLLPLATVLLLEKDWKNTLKLSLLPLAGGAAYIGYNYWLFERFTIQGGYAAGDSNGFGNSFFSFNTLEEIAMGLFTPNYGLLFASPFIGLLIYGAFKQEMERKHIAIGAAGIIYILMQWGLNRASAGFPINYRYPLEMIAMMPILFAYGLQWAKQTKATQVVTLCAVVWSLIFQINFAIEFLDTILHRI